MTVAMVEVLSEINKMTDIEKLRTINLRICDRIRELRIREANSINWYIGQKVRLKPKHQNSRPFNKIGIVEKVNSVRLKVRFDKEPLVWNIPKTMLETVD